MLPLRHTADFKSCKKEDKQPVLSVGGFKIAEDIGHPLTAKAEGGIMVWSSVGNCYITKDCILCSSVTPVFFL